MASRSLTIPSDFVDAANALGELNHERFEALLGVLTERRPEISRPLVARELANLAGWEDQLADNLVWMLLSLIGMKGNLGYETIEELAAAVSRSEQIADAIDRAQLRERLAKAISSEACQLFAHGHDLISEHEHLLAKARILSDIRPLFDPDAEIQGAVIGHVLRLNLFGSEPRTIDIALDLLDLKELKDIVERAYDKDARLRTMVKDSNTVLVLPMELPPND